MSEKNMPFIWAHRGASGHEIDNTMESFKLALDMGADGLESDIHQSKDGHLILFHDNKVDWEGKNVKPNRLTLKELQSIDLGKGRKIPLARDVFEYFKEKTNRAGEKVRYSLDVKKIRMAIPLTKLAEEIGVADAVEITPNDNCPSFWRIVEKIRKISNKIHVVDSAHFNLKPLKILFKKMYFQNWEKFKLYNVKGINVKATLATDDLIEDVKRRDLKMYVWDCHDKSTLKTFMRKNVDALYSNYPDMAVSVRKEIPR